MKYLRRVCSWIVAMGQYQCPYCDFSTDSITEMGEHLRSAHGK